MIDNIKRTFYLDINIWLSHPLRKLVQFEFSITKYVLKFERKI